MKTKILLLFLFCWIGIILGQNLDNTGELRALIEKIIEEKKNNDYSIAKIKIKDSVMIGGKSFKIDSARFDLKEGMLTMVKIYVEKNKVFYNDAAPIAVTYPKRLNDSLISETNNRERITLRDAVEIDAYKRFGFLPNDNELLLTNHKNERGLKNYNVLSKDGNLGSLVNFVAYSDLLGLLGDEPNALVHFEANAKFYFHRKNMRNSFLYLTPTFQPSFNYNKLDSKFDTIRTQANKINPTEIFRRHSYSVGIELTALKWEFRPANSLELNTGYQYLSSKVIVIDGLKENEIRSINHLKYLDLTFKSKVLENFGIDLSGKYLWQTLNQSKYFEKSSNTMIGFRGSIYYFPPKSKGNDKIFIRFTNYLVNNKRDLDFSQIQIGFSKSLSFSKKE